MFERGDPALADRGLSFGSRLVSDHSRDTLVACGGSVFELHLQRSAESGHAEPSRCQYCDH